LRRELRVASIVYSYRIVFKVYFCWSVFCVGGYQKIETVDVGLFVHHLKAVRRMR